MLALVLLVNTVNLNQSIKDKLFLSIIPMGIVAYAFTTLWDNLCRNSCISHTSDSDYISNHLSFWKRGRTGSFVLDILHKFITLRKIRYRYLKEIRLLDYSLSFSEVTVDEAEGVPV